MIKARIKLYHIINKIDFYWQKVEYYSEKYIIKNYLKKNRSRFRSKNKYNTVFDVV